VGFWAIEEFFLLEIDGDSPHHIADLYFHENFDLSIEVRSENIGTAKKYACLQSNLWLGMRIIL